jgi:3-methyladenine DNA glycosylase/8-oxoguanine DNA glycosylase
MPVPAMRLETTLRPARPYSLADSVRGAAGGTRRLRSGVLDLWDLVDGTPVRMRVGQRPDGTLAAWADGAPPERALERLRFLLALDVDHSPFLRRARRDPLLRDLVLRTPGMRPMRRASPAHALLAAVCGQLVAWREAVRLERRVLALATGRRDGLTLPPSQAQLAGLAPARLRACGLAAPRAAALARVARGPELARLASRTAAQVRAAVTRERGLGPWSAGVIALYGLGRYDLGLVGDLGLVRLMAWTRGVAPAPEETAELLAPYEEWAGLASQYLLLHPLARRRGPGPRPARVRPAVAARG